MIQRKQTLWLLLAALCSLAGLKFSFYYVTLPNQLTTEKINMHEINGMENLWLNVFSIATGVLCMVAVFLYKNRKLQQRICWISILTEIMVAIGYYQTIKNYSDAKPALGSVLQVIITISILLAIAGIRKDDKIIAESDRLR